jgi:hypothetical protein
MDKVHKPITTQYYIHRRQNLLEFMMNVPITETAALRTINSTKNNNSSGHDEISSNLLQSCAQYVSKPLAYIHSTTINLGSSPDRLKHSGVVPVYKNGDKSFIAN